MTYCRGPCRGGVRRRRRKVGHEKGSNSSQESLGNSEKNARFLLESIVYGILPSAVLYMLYSAVYGVVLLMIVQCVM